LSSGRSLGFVRLQQRQPVREFGLLLHDEVGRPSESGRDNPAPSTLVLGAA